jgi:hypothetical protein
MIARYINGQKWTQNKVIDQLKSMVEDRKSLLDGKDDHDAIYMADIIALKAAIYAVASLHNTESDHNDSVNHPQHYCIGGIEVIKYIRAKLSEDEYHGYLKGSVIKYLSRAGHKGDEKEDLEKARWYLERMICEVESWTRQDI